MNNLFLQKIVLFNESRMFNQDNYLVIVLEILLIIVAVTAFAFLLTKYFRNARKGGGSMPVTIYGATDAFMDTNKKKAVEIIVEERAGKKIEEQSSDEPYNKMSEFWDDRYQCDEYVYGFEPNEFFKEVIDEHKPGKILLPADGEGRNSVYAAIKGWKVDAFDFSRNAIKKALGLADKNKVKINYYIDDLINLSSNKNSYDAIALIYVHLTPDLRRIAHKNIVNLLEPGGILILEAFAKEQINNDTGGPKNLEMLFSKKELENDFQNLEIDFIEQTVKNNNEGKYHTGKSDVLRLIGHKRK